MPKITLCPTHLNFQPRPTYPYAPGTAGGGFVFTAGQVAWDETGEVTGIGDVVAQTEQTRVLDEHLWFREQENLSWVCSGEQPTIADIAIFPDVILSEEGGVARIEYPALRRWTDRVKRIPGFVPMPGIFPVGDARSLSHEGEAND